MCKLHILLKKGEIFSFTNQVLGQKSRFDTLDSSRASANLTVLVRSLCVPCAFP